MIKLVRALFILSFFLFFVTGVSGVLFADDYIYLFEDGVSVPGDKIIIDLPDASPEIYSGEVFIRSQILSKNLSIYKTNETELLDYVEWRNIQQDESVDHDMYIEEYIKEQMNNSIYNITIKLPEPEDKETYGNTIGVYRYFNVDIKTGDVDLFDTKKPKDTSFGLLIVFCAIIVITILMHKKLVKSP